jgi:uncharacterized protein DUF4136
MFVFRGILILLSLLGLSACADTPSVASVHYLKQFDFVTIKNYSFYDRNSDDFDYQSISDVTRNAIEIAIENQLEQQGFIYQPFDKAEIIVSYFWVGSVQEKPQGHNRQQKQHPDNKNSHQAIHSLEFNKTLQLRQYNRGVKYCRACLSMPAESNVNHDISTAPSALIIDLIAPKLKRSVWRSSYPIVVKEKENSQELQQKIQRAVKQMLAQYPKN